jgi:2-keto-3-deoxy-L-rhamnonate aldolase RhmA
MSVSKISLRQHLLQGGCSYGPLLLSDSPVVAEIMALAGYGHIVIDHEHAQTDVRSGQAMLQAIQSTHSITPIPATPIIRVPAHDQVYMKKALDTLRLPGGVLVPMVNDAATAYAVVQSTRYPLQLSLADESTISGSRGCASPFVRASGWGASEKYAQQCQEDLLVMVQVETVAGVAAIPEIAAVPGVDGIFLGPMDLSCSIGKMGQFDDPEVAEVIAAAELAVNESQAFLGGFRSPSRSIRSMVEAGYAFVCGSIDVGLLRDAARLDAIAGFSALQSEDWPKDKK